MVKRQYCEDIDGRKCLKCKSKTTAQGRWLKYKNGWQCFNCYMSEWTAKNRQNGRNIEFHTVFEADKAAKLFKWERHHDHGSVKKHVTYWMYLKLKRAGIGFWVIKNDNGSNGGE